MIDTVKENVSENVWTLTVFVAVGGWVLYRAVRTAMEIRQSAKEFVTHVLEERLPVVIKQVLSNGVSDLMVKLNQEQDKRWRESMETAFREHEVRENEQVNRALTEAKGEITECSNVVVSRLDEHDARLKHVEGLLAKWKGQLKK